MKPIDYYISLSEQERIAYAARANCSMANMNLNLFRRKGVKKQPRFETVVRLVMASEGRISLPEAIDYFLVQPALITAQRMGCCYESGTRLQRPPIESLNPF